MHSKNIQQIKCGLRDDDDDDGLVRVDGCGSTRCLLIIIAFTIQHPDGEESISAEEEWNEISRAI